MKRGTWQAFRTVSMTAVMTMTAAAAAGQNGVEAAVLSATSAGQETLSPTEVITGIMSLKLARSMKVER